MCSVSSLLANTRQLPLSVAPRSSLQQFCALGKICWPLFVSWSLGWRAWLDSACAPGIRTLRKQGTGSFEQGNEPPVLFFYLPETVTKPVMKSELRQKCTFFFLGKEDTDTEFHCLHWGFFVGLRKQKGLCNGRENNAVMMRGHHHASHAGDCPLNSFYSSQ